MNMQVNRRYIFLIGALLFVGVIAYLLSDILAYVLIAWVFAMLGHPIMEFFLTRLKLRQKKWGPSLSSLLTILVILGIFVTLVIVLVPPIISQTANLANIDYFTVLDKLNEPLGKVTDWIESIGIATTEGQGKENLTEAIRKYFSLGKISDFFSSIIGAAGNLIFSLFAILFILFFFLREQGIFTSFLVALAPTQYEKQVEKIVEDSSYLLRRYFVGILTQITCITILVFFLLSILQIKNALLIAFFAAIINVIPYLGPLIGAIFGIFITAAAYVELPFYPDLFNILIQVAGIFAVMQLTDNLLFQPFIFSNSVKAHPLEIFIVILIGGKFGGILGMVLAIPTYTVIRVIARTFLSEFKIVQKMTGGMG